MTHFDLIDCNVASLEIIEAFHPKPASDKPSLGGCFGPAKKGKKRGYDAERESARRKGIRELCKELSRFYEPPAENVTWRCPKLLTNSKLGCDHSTL